MRSISENSFSSKLYMTKTPWKMARSNSSKVMRILIWQKQACTVWGKSRFRWRTSWINIVLWNIWCQKG